MNIKIAGAVATVGVMILGAFMISPVFLHPEPRQMVLLSFSIKDDQNLPAWCSDVFSILKKHGAGAAVFISGVLAEKFPSCVTQLPKNVDIGSQGYNYVEIPSMPDYAEQLEEIQKGKEALDRISGFDSKLFKSPYGKTDSNIYSLLTRASILADFSYDEQYNKFYQDKFIWFKIRSYEADEFDPQSIGPLTDDSAPIIITFSNTTPPQKLDQIISELRGKKVAFVSASDLVGYDLRGEKS